MKTVTLAILALVLAFAVVEGTSLLQNSPSPVLMKGESVDETGARLQASQPASDSSSETLAAIILGPFVIAASCYLLAKRRA